MNCATLFSFIWIAFLPTFSQIIPCDTTLSAVDFAKGTYRITQAGKYCLAADIVFDPLAGTVDSPNGNFNWFPTDASAYPACDALKNGAFALGYFAAISIEVDNVEIDLYGYKMAQSFEYHIQQRFFSVIEIGKAPFMTGVGPNNFGPLHPLKNIYIHNGSLGLSSHHGIHSNEASNVAGIQFNGFSDVTISDVDIGPSATNVVASGYYSNAKFLSLALRNLVQAMEASGGERPRQKKVIFSGNRRTNLQEVYDNLLLSMDIAFRHFIDASTQSDLDSAIYAQSIDLYSLPSVEMDNNLVTLPDGSSLYGLVMHSKNVAVLGFGNFQNDAGDGEIVNIQNLNIHNLANNVNEVPAVYFDECDGASSKTVLKGPFGDVLDLRQMVDDKSVIDDGGDITTLSYKGNPLSDAQIALSLFTQGTNSGFGSVTNVHFLKWALEEYGGDSMETLPQCVQFMCNGDIMLHTNKGLIGARFDLIEDIEIDSLTISDLRNKSPLSSYACQNYTGQHDGGSLGQLEMEGSMGTDVAGFTMYGGDVVFKGDNSISDIFSDYGSSMGMFLMADSELDFDIAANMKISSDSIVSGTALTKRKLTTLKNDNKYPYPNNFFECNVLLDRDEDDAVTLNPNPPNGVDAIECRQNAIAAVVDPISDEESTRRRQRGSRRNDELRKRNP